MRDPNRDRREPAGTGLDLTSPALWAFLGEFPAAGLALGAWVHGEPASSGSESEPDTVDRR